VREATPLRPLQIVGRHHLDATKFSSRADFDTEPGTGTLDLTDVVNGPDFLVYCLDYERQRVVYADNGQALRSPAPPFLYLEQRRVANRLAELPFGQLGEIAFPRMSPTFIISPGRCGSTLLVQLLRAAGVDAISEPDSYTNLANQRAFTTGDLPRERELVQACTSTFFRGWGASPVIKLRGVGCFIVKQLLEAIPDARFVVLFRDRRAWVQSHSRQFGFDAVELSDLLRQCVIVLREIEELGRRATVLWYEDLVRAPLDALAPLVAPDALSPRRQQVLDVLARDSQAGSPVQRAAGRQRGVPDLELFEELWGRDQPLAIIKRYGLERLL
jgi:hypothetical protein